MSDSDTEGDESPECRVSLSLCDIGKWVHRAGFWEVPAPNREVGLSGMELVESATWGGGESRQTRWKSGENRFDELCNDLEIEKETYLRWRMCQASRVRWYALKSLPLDEKEDLKTYLCHFERWVEIQKWDLGTWAVRLGTMLRGKVSDLCGKTLATVILGTMKS